MHRFKVGQKVVALETVRSTYNDTGIYKGQVYEVSGLCCCEKCGKERIMIKGETVKLRVVCLRCNYGHESIVALDQNYFAPIENIADAVHYKLTVAIPELTEIKEYQNQ